MHVSKLDIENKKFTKKMMGYSVAEVDQFLEDVADALGQALDEKKSLAKKIKRLEASIEEYRERDQTLRDTLMSTQKMVEDIKAAAGKEAENIVGEAKNKAEAAIQQSHNRVAQLHEEVEGMKRQRAQFQAQFRALLETHLKLLEEDDPALEKLEELESKIKYLKKAE